MNFCLNLKKHRSIICYINSLNNRRKEHNMDITLHPHVLGGTIDSIPSKSVAHRMLICAALSETPTQITISKSNADIDATVNCLRAMGSEINIENGVYSITPVKRSDKSIVLDCGESGSTLRFILPVAAALGLKATFVGAGRLPDRPLGELRQQLIEHGIGFSAEKLPFEISGTLRGGEFTLPGNVSSQYITGLLLALPLCGGGQIKLSSALESAPYIDITAHVSSLFGVDIRRTDDGFAVGSESYRCDNPLIAEGDWSSAAFFLAAGAIGGEITIRNMNPHSPQGDKAVADILRQFGADVTFDGSDVTAKKGALHGIEVDLKEIPDCLPILAVVAACAEGKTRFYNGARLRLKESDRLFTTASMLRAFGIECEEKPDELIVSGGTLTAGETETFNDHRIAMAASVAASLCGGKILGAQCVAKSYPDFYDDYVLLGGITNGYK